MAAKLITCILLYVCSMYPHYKTVSYITEPVYMDHKDYIIKVEICFKYMYLRKHAHATYRDFFCCKIENFQLKIFNIFAQNIDCEPPHRGGSKEYPHSMFWIRYIENK